jgi:L-arabinose transport system substrate-binding protein
MKKFLTQTFRALAALAVLALAAHAAPAIKIGFLVKQPEEPWFQLEWKFADRPRRNSGSLS